MSDDVPSRPRILVVDDELSLRMVLGRGLTRYGFDVFLEKSAADALAQLAARGGFEAVVTDISMPGMSGVDLAEEVVRCYPGTPVLFVTASAAPDQLLQNPLVRLLHKPVRIGDIVASVRELIAAAA